MSFAYVSSPNLCRYTHTHTHTHTHRPIFPGIQGRSHIHNDHPRDMSILWACLNTDILSSIISLIWEPEFLRSISSDSETQIQKAHVKVLFNRTEEITMTIICAISGQIIKREPLWVGWIHKHSPFPWRTQSHTQAHDLASGVRGLGFIPDLCSLIQVSLDNQYVQPNYVCGGCRGRRCIMKSREMNSILPKTIKTQIGCEFASLSGKWLA